MMLEDDKKRYNLKDGSMPGDLNKDGVMSGYEQARQDAIEENMRDQKALGGIIAKLSQQFARIFKDFKGTRPEFNSNYVFKLRDDYSKLSSAERQNLGQRFMESVGKDKKNISEKEFDMFMVNDVFLDSSDISKLTQEFNKDYSSQNSLADLSKKELDFLLGRKAKAEGGEMDDQMSMLMKKEQELPMESEMPMESDEEMEDNYLDFILDEALTEEEEDMLMSKLEQDEQLSMLFDKVVEVASEFAGSGPVEGPGTGVSDSIPARLSDGEFVFTAKAVEEIGADNLMAMMKDAEMKADERQGMANGGEAEEEDTVVMQPEQEPVRQDIRVTKETVGSQASMQEQQDLVDEEIKKGMLSTRPYVRS